MLIFSQCKKEDLLDPNNPEKQVNVENTLKSGEPELFYEFFTDDENHANDLVLNFIEYTDFSEGEKIQNEDKESIVMTHWLLEAASNFRRPDWADITIDTLLSYTYILDLNSDSVLYSDMAEAFEDFETWLATTEESLEKQVKIVDVQHPEIIEGELIMKVKAAFGIDNSGESSSTWPIGWLSFPDGVQVIEDRINITDNLGNSAWLANVVIVNQWFITPQDADTQYNCQDCLYSSLNSQFDPAEYQNAYEGIQDLSSILIQLWDSQFYPTSYGLSLHFVDLDFGVIPGSGGGGGNPMHIVLRQCGGGKQLHY